MHAQNSQRKQEESVSLNSEDQSCSDESAEDRLAYLIRQLMQFSMPIFLVEKKMRVSEEYSKQQQLKQKILSYNRKEKSLERLSIKFIQIFEGKPSMILELDKVISHLNVQRRRVYDIVNIFESLQVLKKMGKNNYVWRGLKMAIQTIKQYQRKELDRSPIYKKQKSLQILAQRFLNLLIFSGQSLPLEQAAKMLMGTQDLSIIKTKIRRLYDIVNVFKSLGVVRKVRLPNNKSGYEWKGTKQLQNIIQQKQRQRQQRKIIIIEQKENVQKFANEGKEKRSKIQGVNSQIGLFKKYSFEPQIIGGQ